MERVGAFDPLFHNHAVLVSSRPFGRLLSHTPSLPWSCVISSFSLTGFPSVISLISCVKSTTTWRVMFLSGANSLPTSLTYFCHPYHLAQLCLYIIFICISSFSSFGKDVRQVINVYLCSYNVFVFREIRLTALHVLVLSPLGSMICFDRLTLDVAPQVRR